MKLLAKNKLAREQEAALDSYLRKHRPEPPAPSSSLDEQIINSVTTAADKDEPSWAAMISYIILTGATATVAVLLWVSDFSTKTSPVAVQDPVEAAVDASMQEFYSLNSSLLESDREVIGQEWLTLAETVSSRAD